MSSRKIAMILVVSFGLVAALVHASDADSNHSVLLNKSARKLDPFKPDPWDVNIKKQSELPWEKIPQTVAQKIVNSQRKSTLRRRELDKPLLKTNYVGRFQVLMDATCSTPSPILLASCEGNSIQFLGASDDSIACESVSSKDGEWDEIQCTNSCTDASICQKPYLTALEESETFGEVYFSCSGEHAANARFTFEDSGDGSCGAKSLLGASRNYHIAQLGVLCTGETPNGGFSFEPAYFKCSSSASRGNLNGKHSCYSGDNCPLCTNIPFSPVTVTMDLNATRARCAALATGETLAAVASRELTGVSTPFITQISSSQLLPDQRQLTFSHATLGPIASDDPFFRSYGIREVNTVGSFDSLGDGLTHDTNALCSTAGGSLSIVPPDGAIDNPVTDGTGFSFKICQKLTQFGFVFVDQTNVDMNITFSLVSNGVVRDFFTYVSVGFPAPPIYFQTLEPVEEIQVLAEMGGGWCLDDVVLAGYTGGTVCEAPSSSPSISSWPTTETAVPTVSPTVSPSKAPTAAPTPAPTASPSTSPLPSSSPTDAPTNIVELISSADLLPDQQELDFDQAAIGPISGSDPLFRNVGLKKVSLVGSFITDGDLLSDTRSALCSTGGGTLSVVPPGEPMDNVLVGGSGFLFQLTRKVTQFGFTLVDQQSVRIGLTFSFSSGATEYQTYNYTSLGLPRAAPIYFQIAEQVEEIQVLSEISGGWCLDDIVFAGYGDTTSPTSSSPSVSSYPTDLTPTLAPSLSPVIAVQLITKAELLPDQQLLDFNLAAVGPIDGSDPIFHDKGVSDVNLLGDFSPRGDRLGSSSRGLCSTSGILTIVAPNGLMDSPIAENTGFSFRMCQKVTQFGFVVVDQSNVDMVISFHLVNDGEVFATYIYRSIGFPTSQPIYFQTAEPVEEIRVLGESGGGWCIDDVVFAGYSSGGVLCDAPSTSPSESSWPTTETANPTVSPSIVPTAFPTTSPTPRPSTSPTTSKSPSSTPTAAPTDTVRVIDVGDLLGDQQVLSFDRDAVGPINGDEYLAQGIQDVALVGSWNSRGDTLSANVGNALCSTAGGILSIVAPDGPMDHSLQSATGSGYTFKTCQKVTQFGYVVADQGNVGMTVTFRMMSNGAVVATYTYLSQSVPSPPIFFETVEPVDEIQVSTGASGGWCLDTIVFAGFAGFNSCREPTVSPTAAPTEDPPLECKLCFLPSPLTWPMSQYLAESKNCSLASIETESELSRAATELKRHMLIDKFWTGGAKDQSPSNWIWADGSGFSGNHWAPNQPDGMSDGDSYDEAGYVAIARDEAGGSALFDEVGSISLPSIWECCSGCPEL